MIQIHGDDLVEIDSLDLLIKTPKKGPMKGQCAIGCDGASRRVLRTESCYKKGKLAYNTKTRHIQIQHTQKLSNSDPADDVEDHCER